MSLTASRPPTKAVVVVGKSTNSKKAATVAAVAHSDLYSQILINRTIPVSINNVGNNIKETLTKAVAQQIEGKCIVEGYIKPDTIEIITFSSGLVAGSHVIFEVVFQCYVCSPVEGMHIKCIAKHINKAGIRAEVKASPSPVVIFIARDHNYASPLFGQVKENDEIKVRVIGQRFELNDTYISIIAELVDDEQVSSNKTAAGEPVLLAKASSQSSSAPSKPMVIATVKPKAPATASVSALASAAPSVKKRVTIVTKKPKITINP